MTKSKTLNIILSVAIAVFLWAYVINVVNPQDSTIIKDIPVELTGLDVLEAGKLTIAGDGSYTVDVTVSATRQELAGLKAGNITAKASVAGLTAGQNYINVAVSVPDNITLEDVRSQKIQVYVDELIEAEKDVCIIFPEPQEGFELTVLDQSAEKISVKGAASLVNMINLLRVDFDTKEMTPDNVVSQSIEPIPLDSEGNIVTAVKLAVDAVEVTAVEYELKTVPLKVTYTGNPGLGAELRSVNVPVEVTVKGPSSALENITELEAEPINIEGISSDRSVDVECILPRNVMLKEGAALKAVFKVVQTGDISFTYTKDDIAVKAPADGSGYELLGDVSVTVRASGELSAVKKLGAEDLQPSADLSVMGSGNHSVLLTASAKIDGVTITITPQYLDVYIGEQTTPEDPSSSGSGTQEGGETPFHESELPGGQ